MIVAILSDIHGNLDALGPTLADIDGQGAARIMSLGDNVGYGAEPEGVLRALAARRIPSVQGNHELGLVDPAFRDWFNPVSRLALERTRDMLSLEGLALLRTFPRAAQVEGAWCVHGCPPDSVRTYLFEVEDDDLARRMDAIPARLCFVGHTHQLAVRELGGDGATESSLPRDDSPFPLRPDRRYVVNVGSVGQPRDGDMRAKYALWDTERGEIRVRRISYDAASAATKILAAGLPEAYARRLTPTAGKPCSGGA